MQGFRRKLTWGCRQGSSAYRETHEVALSRAPSPSLRESRYADGAEGGEAPPATSSVPDAKLEHVSEDIATNKLHIPAAEGGSTAGKNPVYGTPKLRASSDSTEREKSLGEQYRREVESIQR